MAKIRSTCIISREQLMYSLVEALDYGWLDVGQSVGELLGKQKKFRKQINNPGGTTTLVFEAHILTEEEYKKDKGFAYFVPPPKEEGLSLLIILHVVVLSLSTIAWLVFK